MKHLNKYNEELRPDTYRNAAVKLQKHGHINRVNKLKDWAFNRSKNELINRINSIGTFDMRIGDIDGKFYLNLKFDKDTFIHSYENWISGDSDSLYLDFLVGVVPVDNISVIDTLEVLPDSNGCYFIGDLQIQLGLMPDGSDLDLIYDLYKNNKYDNRIPNPVNPSSSLYFDNWGNDINFTDRRNANKFRKALINIFKGSVNYRESIDNPGGLKEEIMDFLLSDNNFLDFDTFRKWLDSLGKMNINRLYKD